MKILEYIHLTLKMLTAILRSCLAVLCSIFCFVSVAQAPSIEDLKLKIYIAPNDSVKGMAYYDLFNATRYKDLPLAIRYADSGLMIFTKLLHRRHRS